MFMVYFKGTGDRRFHPMSLITGEIFNRLAFAPMYNDNMLPDVIRWIEHNKACAPECCIQCRKPGTRQIIYQ